MDKLERYRAIIKEVVKHHGKFQSSIGNVDTYGICDEQTDNYLVLDVGWLPFGRQHAIPLHIRIKNNKVWLEWDGTDQEIAQQLIQAGVAEEDLVFPSPQTAATQEAELIAA